MTNPAPRLLVKGAAFLALNAVLAVAVLKVHDATLHYQPWETDSILLVMPEDTHKDLVFLGTSHAYLFSRFKENHDVTEAALGRTFFDMALPQGGGVVPARFYLETYWESGNTAGRAVYFLDPFVLYNVGANERHKFVYFEPFQFRFLSKLIWNGYGHKRIISYIRSKFSRAWLLQRPEPLTHHTAHTREDWVNPDRIALRMKSLYTDGISDEVFATYTAEFERIVRLCEAHHTPLSVVVLPTLLGPETGDAAMMAWLKDLQQSHSFDVHDWVNAIPDYTKFYNLDHLNLAGVKMFMRDFLRPMLDADDGVTRGGRLSDGSV